MSRYTAKVGNYSYAWGFDTQLSEYFFSKFRMNPKDNEDDCVYSIMSHTTTNPVPDQPEHMDWSNAEILYLIATEEAEAGIKIVPDAHASAIALDLPF